MVKMIKMLTWEVFYKNKIGLLMGLVVIPLIWLVTESYLEKTVGSIVPIEKISYAILLFSVLFLYVAFSYTDVNAKAKQSEGFPSHILRLPLSTWVLSIVPVLIATIIISTFIFLWINTFSDIKLSGLMQFTIYGVTSSFIVWSHAINWGLNTPITQKAALLLLVILGLLFSVTAILNPDDNSLIHNKLYGSAGLIILLLSGYVLCFITLVRTRQNESFQLTLNLSSFKKVNLLSNNTQLTNFTNKLSAQYWYEWKSLAFIIPLIIGLVAIAIVSAVVFGAERKIILMGILMMSTLITMSAHLIASNKLGTEKFNITSHCATRPLSNFELAVSKLNTLAFAIFIAYLLFIITPFLSLLITGLPEFSQNIIIDEIKENITPMQIIAMLLLSLITLFSIFWTISANGCAVLLRDSKLTYLINIIIVIGLGAAFLGFMIYFKGQSEDFKTILKSSFIYQIIVEKPRIIPLTITTSLLLFFTLLTKPFKRVANLKQLQVYAFTCGIGLIVSLGLLWTLKLPIKINTFASYSLVNLFLLCFMPYLLSPINVAKNRHR